MLSKLHQQQGIERTRYEVLRYPHHPHHMGKELHLDFQIAVPLQEVAPKPHTRPAIQRQSKVKPLQSLEHCNRHDVHATEEH